MSDERDTQRDERIGRASRELGAWEANSNFSSEHMLATALREALAAYDDLRDERDREIREAVESERAPIVGVLDNTLLPVLTELHRAQKKFPGFPTDPIHAATIVAEENGELQKAAFQWAYEGGDREAVRKEAIQTAAMAVRFLLRFEEMSPRADGDLKQDSGTWKKEEDE